MILRCTAKVLNLLGARGTDAPPSVDDWYVNLIWIERRKCLLFTHADTLFPIVALDVRKPAITPFGDYVIELIRRQLDDEDLPPDALGPLGEASLARTASRSILAVMNQSSTHIRYRVAAMGGVDRANERIVNRFLRRTPHARGAGYVTPLQLALTRARHAT